MLRIAHIKEPVAIRIVFRRHDKVVAIQENIPVAIRDTEHRGVAGLQVHYRVQEHVAFLPERDEVDRRLNDAVVKRIADGLGNRVHGSVQDGLDNVFERPDKKPGPRRMPSIDGRRIGFRNFRFRSFRLQGIRNSRIRRHGSLHRGRILRRSGHRKEQQKSQREQEPPSASKSMSEFRHSGHRKTIYNYCGRKSTRPFRESGRTCSK